jgi:GTPase Era involved in 16S rRNA processing
MTQLNELQIIKKVIEILNENMMSRDRYASELENFKNREIRAKLNKYRLGVIGVTSSGKSTMINSLLGESLLPVAARPSSSQLVSCYRSSNRCSTVYFEDGREKILSGKDLNQELIKKYGDEDANAKNKERVKQIELTTPDFAFGDEIILVDSPGLDAYGDEGHEHLTMSTLLPTIDFCLFVTTCKTNSDEKMLSILNTISDYNIPVIIVQNMIDSLKPGLDGKSVVEVAQELRVRVERIITNSKIKDKSKVHIVQISAINALKARENKLKTKEDIALLEKSNYEKLVSVVNMAFEQVRPEVEACRMQFLKNEIERIANAALVDSAGVQGVQEKFEYAGTKSDYENKKGDCIGEQTVQIKKFDGLLSEIENTYSFDEEYIKSIKEKVSGIELAICDRMRRLNEEFKGICKKLNVDSRNIITDFRFDKPELSVKTKTTVVKEGHWELEEGRLNWLKSIFGCGDYKWVDDSYTVEETDIKGTRNNSIKYVNKSRNALSNKLERWIKSIDATEKKLFAELENRRSEYEARKKKALDCLAYKKIGTDLKKIAASIKGVQERRSGVKATCTDVKQSLTEMSAKKEIFSMFNLAEQIRIKIQNESFKFFCGNAQKHVIIGWDSYCESKFLRYAFGKKITPEAIKQGRNELSGSIQLMHKPGYIEKCKGENIYVLVNASQIGAAKNEIARLTLSNVLRGEDTLYFVIQDFNEIINGNSVSETLDNVIAMKNDLGLKKGLSCKYLLVHDNPIYNLVAVESQYCNCKTHSDETRVLYDLQNKFSHLFPKERKETEKILSVIIKKLGRV